MKYKKYSYILVLILMLLVGMNGVNAATEEKETAYGTRVTETKTCYYVSNDNNFKARLKAHYNIDWKPNWQLWATGNWVIPWGERAIIDHDPQWNAEVTIDQYGRNENGDPIYIKNAEFIVNWHKNAFGIGSVVGIEKECLPGKSVCFGYRYKKAKEATASEPSCPAHIVFWDKGTYVTFATDSLTQAKEAEANIKSNGDNGYYASLTTSDKYYEEFIEEDIVDVNNDTGELSCTDYEAIFGSKDNPESIRYMVNEILMYVRIIVPILIILLGTLDFAKAVISGKEDGMRKAQADFIKRVLIGVAVFFVPTLVDVIMSLADIVWAGNYIHCPL